MGYKSLTLIIATVLSSAICIGYLKYSNLPSLTNDNLRFIDSHKYQIRLLTIFIPLNKNSKKDRKNKETLAKKYFSDIVKSKRFDKIFEIGNEILKQNNDIKFFDLGWISQGKLPEYFDKQVFSLKNVGETTMFQTELGFHIVQLMNIRKSENFNSLAFKYKEMHKTTYQKKSYENMIFIKGGSFWAGSTEQEIDMRLKLCNIYVGKHIGGCDRE